MGTEQSKIDSTRQKCESQRNHANLEEKGLRTNMALMTVVHNHTQVAIASAKRYLKQILSKIKDLQMSAEEFSATVKKTVATLEDQSKDRRTIMSAVSKARGFVARLPSGGSAGCALLDQIL